ncbi:MAG: carboxypeptidase-like regulatory domain-containing protein [Clostridiales bacterium]|jgi:hypothetical protein|nr:carboxypeptidase-like regulatory domain-containing protein [Clostridiales bacterium]
MNIIHDHFTGAALDRDMWLFCNMTTPSCEVPKRIGDSQLGLPEHDIWNEGNCLLSRCFLQEKSEVSALFAGWDPECGGAALGFYGGGGSFTRYVLLAVTDTRVELRVHSGCQNGESFMSGGQPKWLVVADAAWEKRLPVRLTLRRDGRAYTAELNGEIILEAHICEIDGDARAVFKALPWKDRLTPRYAYLDWARLEGAAPRAAVTGTVTDEAAGRGIPFAGVHAAGFEEFFTRADAEGRFTLKDVPRGERTFVAAAEGYTFARVTINCVPGAENRVLARLRPETAENCPRREYNNPSFDRSHHEFLQLNGTWEFCFDPGDTGMERHLYRDGGEGYDRHIRVPFSWSSLMGFGEEHLVCGDTLHETNTLFNNYHLTGELAWYRRKFTAPAFSENLRTILHIGACSNVTYVWLDGVYKGMREDEYSDLTFDLGELKPGSVHTLVIRARYPHHICSHNMGKQIFWFASAPGIWQSVWLEPRGTTHLTRLHLRPDLDFNGAECARASVHVRAAAEDSGGADVNGTVALSLTAPSGRVYAAEFLLENGRAEGDIPIEEPELWDYREGRLYEAEAALRATGARDSVRSRVGLRKIETKWLPGHSPEETSDPLEQYQYLYLNGRPFYIIGVLDQCYNAFGIYTYRGMSAEGEEGRRGSITYDIDRTLAYGYNLSRVHIKENEPLWYHECDRQGLPVWTEHPGNFYAVPEDPNWRGAYNRELDGMLERLYNHPCIVAVSTINESWGVCGGHCMTPWEDELRAGFIEDGARRAKAAWPHVLVCDNSGFGKTNACEINDFHLYPGEYGKAKARWERLNAECHPGSLYNCIPALNAVQCGQPIVISEFLHINGIDMQLRMFEKIAGYVRMNVASHETEDSGPLTAERYERDYGYVDHHMNPVGYNMVNNMDMVALDKNRITFAREGDEISVDVYTSHFSRHEAKAPVLRATLTGIDTLGRYVRDLRTWEVPIEFTPFKAEKQEPLKIKVPAGIRGAYLFAYIADVGFPDEEILCRGYCQFCVKGAEQEGLVIDPGSFARAEGDYLWLFLEEGACAMAVHGPGALLYKFGCGHARENCVLALEAGAREGKNAVKVTDERLWGTSIKVLLDGKLLGILNPKDDPSDERGLFSNAAQGGDPYHYRMTGRLGYGERFELAIPALAAGSHALEFCCGPGGMTIYGAYTGRYGFAPVIL